MTMNKIFAAATAILVGAAPIAAFAAPAALPVTNRFATAPVMPVVVHPLRSTVHYADGERFDVPNSLLRNRDTLINGLPPEPLQFD